MTDVTDRPGTAAALGPAPEAPLRPRRARPPRLGTVVVVVALTVACAYFLLPIWWLVVAATKSQGDLATTNGLWFSAFHLRENLQLLFSVDGGRFPRWVGNSILYAVGGAGVGTVVSAMCGYALAKFVFPGRLRLFDLVVAGVLVPATALSLPLFMLFSATGLTNTYWAVLLPSIVSPFGVYLARITAAEAVPDEIIEAARLDGASELRIFAQIAWRMMGPALVTIFLVQFVGIWNDFFLPRLVLRDPDLFPLTVGLYGWNVQQDRYPGLQTAVVTGSALSVVPLIAVFLSLQRYWRHGLSAGGLR